MRYYRVIDGPSPLEHKGEKVYYIVVLPESVGIDERNAPVIGCDQDLTDEPHLRLIKMMSVIDVYFDGDTYEYRNQVQTKDDEGNLANIVLELENKF